MDLPLKRYWDLLAKYLKPLRLKVSLLAAFIFAGIGLRLVNPQIIRYFIDTAVDYSDDRNLLLAALTFLGTSLLLQAISVAATYVGEGNRSPPLLELCHSRKFLAGIYACCLWIPA